MSGPIIGVDEVGYGAWAGPLVVCAFMAPDEFWKVEGLNDSKKITKKRRTDLAKALLRDFRGEYAVVTVTAEEIDEMGVAKALPYAMETAIMDLIGLAGVPDRVIVDGEPKGFMGAEYYPKADADYPAVMAASVIAKDFRDSLMTRFAMDYPRYGFDRHVGYGTAEHLEALRIHGMCPLHRRSYRPMSELSG